MLVAAASDMTRQSWQDGRKRRTNALTVPTLGSIPPFSLEEELNPLSAAARGVINFRKN